MTLIQKIKAKLPRIRLPSPRNETAQELAVLAGFLMLLKGLWDVYPPAMWIIGGLWLMFPGPGRR